MTYYYHVVASSCNLVHEECFQTKSVKKLHGHIGSLPK